MSTLDRYKKRGGFTTLLQLIEASPPKKQEQLLNLIAHENRTWESAIKQKMLTVDRIFSWHGDYLVEVLSRLKPLTLAGALHNEDPLKIDKILNCLSPLTKRKIMELIGELNPNAAEKQSCEMKILEEVRGLFRQSILRIEKVEPDLIIPDDIEDRLSHFENQMTNPNNTTHFEKKDTPGPEKLDSQDPLTELSQSEIMKLHIASNESFQPIQNYYEEELKGLRKKVTALLQEVNTLKHDNSILRDKLSTIRKAAS